MASPGSPRKNSWKAKAATQRTKSAGARWIGRIASTALVLLLLGSIVWVLYGIIVRTARSTHLLAIHLEDDDVRQLTLVPFTRQDCQAFQQNARLKVKDIGWSEAEFGKALPKRIRDLHCKPNDVLLLYVTGIGFSYQQKAYIACREADRSRDGEGAPAEGCLEVAALLKDVSRAAGTGVKKVVLLDLGRLGTDPRMGLLVNEFPVLLERDVKAAAATDLWVLNSTALLQTSRISYARQRSLFGQAVEEGLAGNADVGAHGKPGDRTVRLYELYEYVLQACARQAPGDGALSIPGQTPLLMRGGVGMVGSATLNKRDGEDANDPVLVNVAGATGRDEKSPAKPADEKGTGSEQHANPAGEAIRREVASQAQQAVSGAVSTPPVVDRARSAGADIASAGKQVAGAAGEPASKSEPKSATPANGPDKNPPSPGAAPATPGDAGAAPGTGDSAPAASPVAQIEVPEKAPAVLRALVNAWSWRDRIQAASQSRTPIDFAPHLWRELNARLLSLERRYLVRRETSADLREIEEIVRVLHELHAAIDERRPAAKTFDDPLVAVWNQQVAGNERAPAHPTGSAAVPALQKNFGLWCWHSADFVRWFDQASLTDPARTGDAGPAIKTFLDDLRQLGREVAQLVQSSSKRAQQDTAYEPLIKHGGSLQNQFERILKTVEGDRQRALAPETPPAVAQTLAEDLLATPLLAADGRLALCLLLRPLGEAPPEQAPSAETTPARWDATQIQQIKWWEGTDAQWRAAAMRSELNEAVAHLSGNVLPPGSAAPGMTAGLSAELDDHLAAPRKLGQELEKFYSGLPRQIVEAGRAPFEAWRLALLADGLDLADRRNQEARGAGFHWELRVLRNAGRIELAGGPAFDLFEQDYVPLKISARDWPVDLAAVAVNLEFDASRVEVQTPDGNRFDRPGKVIVPLSAGKGSGELVLGVRWKGPKSPPKDARQTRISASLGSNDEFASTDDKIVLNCEWQGARPVELAIHRHGPRGRVMPAQLEAAGGTAALKIIPGRSTGIDLSLANRTRGELSVKVQLLAVPVVPAAPGGRTAGSPTPAELKSLLFDSAGAVHADLVLAAATADGKPAIALKPGAPPESLAFQKPKPPAAEGAPPANGKPPVPESDPHNLNPPAKWDRRHMACVITTDQPAWTWVYLLNLDLVPPRDFLEPRVEYNLETRNVDVTLAVRESSRDLVNDLAREPLTVKLKADRQPGEADSTGLLYGADLKLLWRRPADRRERQFEIDVAGFPRAFRYKIVCAEGREGDELNVAHPAIRIRSVRSRPVKSEKPLTYVVDPLALGDTLPADAPPPADGAAPAGPAEVRLVPGAWAAFPAATREVEIVVAVDLPLESRPAWQSGVPGPRIEVRLEDAARSMIGPGKLIADERPEFRFKLQEDGSLAVVGALAERKYLVPVGNALGTALSLVAELHDDRTGGDSESPNEDRVPVVVGPRPLDLRLTTGDRTDQRTAVTAGSPMRLVVTLETDESSGKPRPNAGIGQKPVAISIRGTDDKLQTIKDEELTVLERDHAHWIARWTPPPQFAEQNCTLVATVFDGLDERAQGRMQMFVKSPDGKPVVAPGKAPTKGTIRISRFKGSTELTSPKIEELSGRAPKPVKIDGQDFWEWANLDLDQGYTVTVDYIHDGKIEVLTSEPNVKPSDPKTARAVPLKKKK